MPVYTIYKIQCGDEVYIGSTRDFIQRRSNHKCVCYNETNKSYNFKIYQAIRANGEWDSKMISPIEMLECETSIEARIREEFWRREYGATLNSRKAHITVEERSENNKEHQRKWRDNHPNYGLEQRNEWQKINKEKHNKSNREYRAKKKAAAINLQNNKPVEEALHLEVKL